MAIIKPKRGSGAPSGLLQHELAVDTTNKRIYIGNGGGTGDLIGSAPGGSDTQVQFNDGGNLGGDSGLTYNKTTDSLTIAGDLAVNGADITTTATGTATVFDTNATTLNIGGVATAITLGDATTATTTLRGGTLVGNVTTQNIFDTTATTINAFGTATTLNIGYDGTSTSSTTNIASGAITGGVTRTINIGTGGLTGVTNINMGYSAGGTITLNSATVVGAASTQALFNTVATTMNFAGAATNLTIGSTTGTTTTRNPTLTVSNSTNSGTIKTASTGSLILTTGAISSGASKTDITITGDADGTGVVQINGGDLYLGVKVDADPTAYPVNIIFEGATVNGFETTLTLVDPTADRTITLPDATGTVVTTGNLTSITSTGTISSGTWNGTEIGIAYGGTGLTTYTAGDLLYYSTGTALSKLAIGTSGYVLTSSGSAPQWTSVTGTGDVVKATSPTLVTPNIGVATGTSLAATGTTDTIDIIASSDGAGIRIAKATTGANSRVGAIRLGRHTTPTSNTFIENNTGILSFYNGIDNTGTLLFSSSTAGTNFNLPLNVSNSTELRLLDDNLTPKYVGLKSVSSLSNSNIYTLPSAVGTANQVLSIATVSGNDATLQWSSVSGGSKTYSVFVPTDNQPPASNYATIDTRNSIMVLEFDAATDESAVFVGVIPEAASLGSGLKVRIHWMADTATSGTCRWGVQIERMNTDEDSDSFDTAATAGSTTNGTSGIITTTEITITTIDSVTAGEPYRLKVFRDADGTSGTDDMTGDAQLVAVEVRSAS